LAFVALRLQPPQGQWHHPQMYFSFTDSFIFVFQTACCFHFISE
jgi:hypothetical protein